MMDLREAKACLDEYRISLATTCEMLRPTVAEGELGEAAGKLHGSLIAMLNTHVKEANILSIMIWKQINATLEQIVEFPDEVADLVVALNQLELATDRAAEVREEYLRKTGASKVNAKGTEVANPTAVAIEAFKREQALRRKEEREEYDRKMNQKSAPVPVETLNTPDRMGHLQRDRADR
jgi:hypothetical protein